MLKKNPQIWEKSQKLAALNRLKKGEKAAEVSLKSLATWSNLDSRQLIRRSKNYNSKKGQKSQYFAILGISQEQIFYPKC